MPDAHRPGPHRLLVGGYAVFVVAAGGRSAVQLATRAGAAPLAFGLSAVAALAYAVGLGLLLRAGGRRRRAVAAWCVAELAGVLAVGTWAVLRPRSFPEPTVWSAYGLGYLLVPLALPVLTLCWCVADPQRRRG